MNNIKIVKINELGFDFIESPYLPPEGDEYYLRYNQKDNKSYRFLKSDEISILKKQGNTADNWNNIKVSENFSAHRVKNNKFYGLIRIGDIDDVYLDFHDLHQPVGIYDSTIVSCDIGSNVAISNVNYLSHYIIDDVVILANINEMATSNYSKFGNGIVKEGEEESVRIKIELSNENGNRAVFPFDGMLSADAQLWSKHRDDFQLMKSLEEMTQNMFDKRRGFYGTVGEYTVIKNCRIVKDVKVGSHAYIKGCNKLKNLTINSSLISSTQLGEGIELVNGIVGYGCHIFYGVKAIRFILADYSTLKYGARLINSFLGSNSTISCCEVLNSLIFNGHEQHHNNSFLCAATVKGQSNIASGATIGSNHNSRANDGEIVASRGFWPGLCTSLKHNSRFSSFNLLAKGSYPAEIDNPFPFALLSNDEHDGSLTVMPAYWFAHNLYALARNSWKYTLRDHRKIKFLNLEFDYLAPDTVNEIVGAMKIMRDLVLSRFSLGSQKKAHDFLLSPENDSLIIEDKEIENSRRLVKILKCGMAYNLYSDFLLFYSLRSFLSYGLKNKILFKEFIRGESEDTGKWINLGGQLIEDVDYETLKNDIKSGELSNWDQIHNRYKVVDEKYEYLKYNQSQSLINLLFKDFSVELLQSEFLRISDYIFQGTLDSRKKDYINKFRMSPYDNKEEMEEVIGKLDNNDFINHIREEIDQLKRLAGHIS